MDNGLLKTAMHAEISVSSPARLHLGFLDLSATLGRRFGSLGLAIEGFPTRLLARPAVGVSATGPGAERARRCALLLKQSLGLDVGLRIELSAATPGHLGLGSGTQMCLAVGTALSRIYGLDTDTGSIAGITGRGTRSGIGVGSFDQGGFLMDGGRGASDGAPPVISRLHFPTQWRIVLLLDKRGGGLHGRHELEAFRRLPPFPSEQAAHLCHLTLMQILPALAEHKLEPFAEGIAELQRRVGDHFAPVQGGRFTSPAVAEALAWAETQGFSGVGQSSWGPTGFVLTDGDASASTLVEGLRSRFGDLSPLNYRIVAGCNQGSSIVTQPFSEPLRSAL